MDLNVIAHLPPEILETIPLATPPAGTSSNFINPQSSGFILTTVTSIFLVFQVIIFAARIYTRAFIARKLRWDDSEFYSKALGVVLNDSLLIFSP